MHDFTGNVDALPEGTLFFPDEPVLRVVAPLPAAQLLETLDPELVGRLIVVDGTQEEIELPVPAEFELLHEHRLGASGRLRFWLLRRMGE